MAALQDKIAVPRGAAFQINRNAITSPGTIDFTLPRLPGASEFSGFLRSRRHSHDVDGCPSDCARRSELRGLHRCGEFYFCGGKAESLRPDFLNPDDCRRDVQNQYHSCVWQLQHFRRVQLSTSFPRTTHPPNHWGCSLSRDILGCIPYVAPPTI